MGDMSPDKQDLSQVLKLLNDEHVRTILAATSAEPRSARELAECCGISASNIYRRLGELQELNLLSEQTRPRPDGNHESTYTAELSALELRFEDGDMTWSLTRKRSDIADELTRMWQNFE
jgi:DNA-binding transcriptional ArsR family regulator